MRLCSFVLSVVLGLGAVSSAHADILDSASSGAGFSNIAPNYLGQSFMVMGKGGYYSISFNFFTPNGTPYALGTGFLLTQEYLGAAGGLSSATPGYLGSAVASGGFYNFGTSVALRANGGYYFYENALADAHVVGANTSSNGDADSYAVSGGNFQSQPGDTWAFQVTGTAGPALPAPEIDPTRCAGGLALLAGGVAVVRGRRGRQTV